VIDGDLDTEMKSTTTKMFHSLSSCHSISNGFGCVPLSSPSGADASADTPGGALAAPVVVALTVGNCVRACVRDLRTHIYATLAHATFRYAHMALHVCEARNASMPACP
jgi:hypothetical protein